MSRPHSCFVLVSVYVFRACSVVAVEQSSAATVAALLSELSATVASVASSEGVQTTLSSEVSALRNDLARTIEDRDATLQRIQQQQQRIKIMEQTQQQKEKDKIKVEGTHDSRGWPLARLRPSRFEL